MSSCFFYQSTGDEALQFLQKLCPNDMDVPIGGVVHTAMLNENGCYENDSSIARLGKNRWNSSQLGETSNSTADWPAV